MSSTKAFLNLQAIILDEIHVLDNTYRGDQLRLLIHRLRGESYNSSFSVYLLSATLSDPVQIAQRYVDNFEVINVPSQREIEYSFLKSHTEIFDFARDKKLKKILCFCNKRETVETVAAELTQFWKNYPVMAHHGSLSRQIREETEKVMKETKVAVCVATSTLEIGIDIGDIDLVVLIDIPWSISALLQRIGRGNRRRGIIRSLGIAKTEEERFILEQMFKSAISGFLPEVTYQPDLSVAVQQSLSYLYQHPEGIIKKEIINILSPICNEYETALILKNLEQKDWLVSRIGKLYPSTKLMDKGERGYIHSNIPDSQDYTVIDIDSGHEIGVIAGAFDDVFILAQRAWQVIAIEGNIIKARRFKGKAPAPLFIKHRDIGVFYYLLPPELKRLKSNTCK